jgi:hypothetical protein
MGDKTEKCANPACGCPAPTIGDYCCEQCERSTTKMESKCHCGHPRCGSE